MLRVQENEKTQRPRSKRQRREAYLDWAIIASLNNSLLLIVALVRPPLAILLPATVLLGLGFSIGAITVLHNAGHGRYSRRYWPNMLAVHTAVPTGLWVAHWTLKHRVHHRLPAGYPDDAFTQAGGLLRLHPLAPRRRCHRFQFVYIWFLYPLAWFADTRSQWRYLLTGYVSSSDARRPVSWRLTTFAIEKVAALVVLLPYLWLSHGLSMLLLLGGATLFAGLVVGCVVALGHINVGLSYLRPLSAEWDWTGHVIATTVSFSTASRFMPWLTGGLTHHLAHHLRPLATRTELRNLHSQMANRSDRRPELRIVEFKTLRAALRGHGKALRLLGMPPPASVADWFDCPPLELVQPDVRQVALQ